MVALSGHADIEAAPREPKARATGADLRADDHDALPGFPYVASRSECGIGLAHWPCSPVRHHGSAIVFTSDEFQRGPLGTTKVTFVRATSVPPCVATTT